MGKTICFLHLYSFFIFSYTYLQIIKLFFKISFFKSMNTLTKSMAMRLTNEIINQIFHIINLKSYRTQV
jgi:hypothetical protein